MRLHRALFLLCNDLLHSFGVSVAAVARNVCAEITLMLRLLGTMGIVLRLREKLRCLNRRFMVRAPTVAYSCSIVWVMGGYRSTCMILLRS